MTAQDKVWRTIECSFDLCPHSKFDAIPAEPYPPYAKTYPFDGMIVREDIGGGKVLARYYHRYIGDEWVEILPDGPGTEWLFESPHRVFRHYGPSVRRDD